MSMVDTVIMADWSARSGPSPARPSADAIWIAVARRGWPTATAYFRTRATAEAALADLLDGELRAGRRALLGADFAFGYPAGFARALTGTASARAVWAWVADRLEDLPDNRNSRFELADAINAALPGGGPFWGCPAARAARLADLTTMRPADSAFARHRRVERLLRDRGGPGRAVKSVWQLYGAGAVGSQVLVGLPMLHRLAGRFGTDLAVWPFEPTGATGATGAPLTLAEIYPAMIGPEVAEALAARPGQILDEWQMRLMAEAVLAASGAGRLAALLDVPPGADLAEEAWILGASDPEALRAGAKASLSRTCR
ncbi:molybdopterin guanine dinucleotide synthesis [Rhodovulum visakhapatnamense]|uniref:Molybdopterin guanine dinucleotide synthesis n=1 Tax=Rhodovulum visakhapatnamense TaxID=364297 RepID=A0ABS1RK99_9RHOB|nr:molybdopterin guanine dinucleotide synthesis [Rhodovulum visakhapatnamense]MBL3571312.1 molybdopterin guanine dinucleotide synthesis [Rhodovulum visakhapatnamense]MBL3579539.1 molybdopterin guanine dinucleotide synthesis [Rhodovulum visakhapatnamense]